jgi:predicted enzyme related to lactoylglutathione lyase
MRPRVVHLELHTRDLPGALEFYGGLCGWGHEEVVTRAGCYRAIDLGGEIGGGVVECPAPHPLWLPYVGVPNIAAATERAWELGATVMLPPREGPAGWRSVVSTPAAGELALWQPKRPD